MPIDPVLGTDITNRDLEVPEDIVIASYANLVDKRRYVSTGSMFPVSNTVANKGQSVIKTVQKALDEDRLLVTGVDVQLEDGTNTTVTGSGTTASPWNVNSTDTNNLTTITVESGNSPTTPTAPATPAGTLISGDTHIEKYDDTTHFWIYTGSWSKVFSQVTAAGGTDYIYSAGNGAMVRCSTLGVTFSISSGTGTFVNPNSGIIKWASIEGTTSDLNSGDFKIVIPTPNLNSSISDYTPPSAFQVINTIGQLIDGPSEANPFKYDEGNTPRREIIGASANLITLKVIDLDTYNNWNLSISF